MIETMITSAHITAQSLVICLDVMMLYFTGRIIANSRKELSKNRFASEETNEIHNLASLKNKKAMVKT